jgi:acyl dehydratase
VIYRVRAVNTATESENKIHDDRVAAEFGFRGGLVPGVTVYGYMCVPLIEHSPEWLDRGWMKVRFLEPVYDGEEVVVRGEVGTDGSIQLNAERAVATATIPENVTAREPFEEHPLPTDRTVPKPEILIQGTPLGSVVEKLETVEPRTLLQFSNEMLVRNFKLGPWIHTGSEIQNYSRVHPGEEISARGVIHERFERKGHEFVVIDVTLVANGRLAQSVRHTAIYRPRNVRTS